MNSSQMENVAPNPFAMTTTPDIRSASKDFHHGEHGEHREQIDIVPALPAPSAPNVFSSPCSPWWKTELQKTSSWKTGLRKTPSCNIGLRSTGARIERRARRRGLSLIETMISVAISTSLLVAVAAAFQASGNAVEMNDTYFRCTQAARVTMNQMLTELRRADAVQASTGIIQVIRPAAQLSPNEIYRQFSYDSSGQRITLQIFYSGGTSSQVYELAANVSSASFGPAEMGTDYNNTQVAVRVPITITCSAGGNNVTLSGAAAPRRAQQF